ncbi:MAG TPA: isoprenylcysteine carboxylmethyltransferase family protein [Rhizomicrobium sp.]|jgi:protein-S-isoprenylcysteine O-methyltransferase Ste14|nr:isoprenylcysteine carboxylmethyltransferase family protein [Rhizomicrobium sp.]
MNPENAIYIPWIVWAATWIAAALWANRTVKRPGGGREWPYRIFEFGGFFALLAYIVQKPTSGHIGAIHIQTVQVASGIAKRLWQLPVNAEWVLVGVATLGFLFAWWARLHLGRLWSGSITRKEGHHVIDTGPYAIVRHPIYTGIIAAGLATAAIKATPLAIFGALLLVVGYIMKGKLEEKFLREELGAETYNAYRRRVPMLLPFGPKSA